MRLKPQAAARLAYGLTPPLNINHIHMDQHIAKIPQLGHLDKEHQTPPKGLFGYLKAFSEVACGERCGLIWAWISENDAKNSVQILFGCIHDG